MTDNPSLAMMSILANSVSASCGVKTAVGSSKTNMRASRYSALRISTR